MRKKSWDTKASQAMFKAILKLKTIKEAKKFFRDLLTQEEIIEFAKRWQAAQMLNQKVPYAEIIRKTKLSSTTVARVSRWLFKGKGGYRLMLNRLKTQTHHPKLSFEKGLR